MPTEDDINDIISEEINLQNIWMSVSNLIRKDIAYIWTEDAQKMLKALKSEASTISLILRRIHRRRRANLEESEKKADRMHSSIFQDFWKLSDLRESNKREREELNTIRELIHALNNMQAKEKWVRRINEELHQIIEELEAEKADLRAIAEQTTRKERAKRIAANAFYPMKFMELRQLGLNTTRYHSLALFFVRHWDKRRNYWAKEDVREFQCAETFLMFSRGIPAIANLINEENWPELLRLAVKIDYEIKYEVIAYTLPSLKPLIQELGLKKVVDDILSISQSEWDGDSKKLFFANCIPRLSDIINKDTWPGFVKIAELEKYIRLFSHSLPAIRDIINPTTWPGIVKLVLKVEESHGVLAFKFLEGGLPSVKHIINEETWPDIVIGFKKLIELNDSQVFNHALPGLKGIITKDNWLAIVQEICDIHKKSAEFGDSPYVHVHIHKAFRYILHIIDDYTRPLVFDELFKTYQLFAQETKYGPNSGQQSFYLGIMAVESFLTKTNFPIVFRKLREIIEKSSHAADLFVLLLRFKHILTEKNMSKIGGDINGLFYEHYKEERSTSTTRNTIGDVTEIFPINSEAQWDELVKEIKSIKKDNASSQQYIGSLVDICKENPVIDDWSLFVKALLYILDKKQDLEETIDDWGAYHMADKRLSSLFDYGFPVVLNLLDTENLYPIIDKLFEFQKFAYEKKYELSIIFKDLNPLFTRFGIQLFDMLITPIVKVQTEKSDSIFKNIIKIYELKGMQSTEDFALIVFICQKMLRKADDILQNIIIKGIEKGIVQVPLSVETHAMKAFLENTPAYLLELYTGFKAIYHGDHTDKDIHYENLFKNLRQLKQDIMSGTITGEYEENLFLAVLYSAFSPEMTMDRNQYLQTYNQREDRQSDIPSVLDRFSGGFAVKMSKGGHVLKEELDSSPWNDLREVVDNKSLPEINPPQLGLQLLTDYINKKLKSKQKKYITAIYAFDVSRGNSLPPFITNHEILVKYTEFIGDRLRNDLILLLLSAAQETYPNEFGQMLGGGKKDFKKLAKTLFGLWNSKEPDKEGKIKSILEKNGFSVEEIDWKPKISRQEIDAWLQSSSTNVISKGLVQRMFNELAEEQYRQMQKELEKFEFKREARSISGTTFTFVLSKRKLHSVAMYNMGVCVAPDDKLWNSPDFWQMIIFDEEGNGCGGVIYRIIKENRKKYLVASIQPSSTILSTVSPPQIYNKIIQFSKLIVRALHYDNLLIPTNQTIHSNRGSIQQEITSRDYTEITLENEYDFSYSPYHYTYSKFYLAA